MNIRRILVVTAIPVLVGTFGFISLNQANAANQFPQIAQAQQPPNQRPEGEQRPHRPDFKAAAAKLGVSEQQLKDALGVPANPPTGDRNQRPPRPDFKAAATKLGVSEQQLKDALGVPANPPTGDRNQRPPRPDFKAAAAKLGVTEQQLKDALGVPPHPPSDQPAPPTNR
ncbi:MAG: hypothetical protein HWQ35_09850 [Nostoc sp. NMS1]|uniref:hypothetical protein n=1 Tax=Nostoc sp. NMS1 TaxID=2815388 RepID=UPI0025F53981|nr:hypothetical protein [Nostoc sp. NMS1]MBN3906837.1 hypothetical protein [Nostoc sp. NMS1]